MNLENELDALIDGLQGAEGDFPSLAQEALDNWELERPVSEEEVLKLALKKDLPKQWYGEKGFGHFNVTLYWEDFIVQIYLMRSMPTEIHDHAFCGAFKSLSGQNIHTSFSFQKKMQETHWVSSGELKKDKSHIMGLGQSIKLEKEGIHQVHRLGDQSITLLVSKRLESSENHYYLYPSFRIKNRPKGPRGQEVSRKLMALKLLREVAPASFKNQALAFVKGLELDEAFSIGTRLGGSEYNYVSSSRENLFAVSLLNILEMRLDELGHGKALKEHSRFLANSQKKAAFSKQFL